jgi:hypothetical protein
MGGVGADALRAPAGQGVSSHVAVRGEVAGRLAVFAERFFGFQLGRRQWVGVAITAAGLVVIGLTGGGAGDPQRASLAALIAVEGAIFATGAALVRVSARRC